ncbi:MAG: NERD domain-containing protein [Deltaproteobacteria bacterium]|jgi:hypothetical protein|nr:NERD domain-containing protein [Deltaproteobacteria bacterium]
MASIIPLNNTAFATSGERRFYAFLRDAVKPDSRCLAWYSPSVDELEPDFILFTPEEGLIVFEVKDWTLPQIRNADTHTFKLSLTADGREESRKNPWRQGRDYIHALMDRIKASCKRLLSTDMRHQGKPRLPIQCGLVFSNISRDEFTATELVIVLPADKILFADDLAFAAAQSDASAHARLRRRLAAMFPPPFPFQLTPEDIAALRELLWPQARIVLPKRAGGRPPEEDAAPVLRMLDAQQESLARRLDADWAVIEGRAGSGKTLVLVAKAVQAHARLRQSGSDLPVLVACYNLTLVHYLKRLLAGHNARLGRKDIQVMHFYELCRSLLREPLAFERENSEYYELVTRMALDEAVDAPPYGAIFVDEGQDFSDEMMAVLRKRLAPGGFFWIALDTAQDLYTISQAWLDDGKLQRFALRNPYRATRKLTEFCASLASFASRAASDAQENEAAAQVFAVHNLEGEAARLRRISDAVDGADYIACRIRELRDQGVPYSEMMILYVSRRYAGLDRELPLFLQDALEERGILASWPARDAQSKAGWDITTDSVTISTIHSMKGMDAEAVFVIGLDALNPKQAPNPHVLAYVACTRARRFLDILYAQETPLIAAMRQAAKA